MKGAPEPVDPKKIWNGWTENYSAANDGFITHAFEEGVRDKPRNWRSLCGVKMSESGWLTLGDNFDACGFDQYWEPGCRKCRRILERRGWKPQIYESVL